MGIEFQGEAEKKDKTISYRVSESEWKDLTQSALAAGFEDCSEYVRVCTWLAKPLVLRLKSNPSLILNILSTMFKDK